MKPIDMARLTAILYISTLSLLLIVTFISFSVFVYFDTLIIPLDYFLIILWIFVVMNLGVVFFAIIQLFRLNKKECKDKKAKTLGEVS